MWVKQALLVLSSILVSLLLMEGLLRLMDWSHPVFAQPDANLGWSFQPNLRGWSTHENTVYVRINRHGFRGPDWDEQRAPDTFRVAVLGDSFVDSTNLPDEHALTTQIEDRLKACSELQGRRPEVLNFGVSGYGTAQQYLLLQQRVRAFRPDLVVLAFYAGNDVMNNGRALSAEDQRQKPYFVETDTGDLQLDLTFRENNTYRRTVSADWQRKLVNASYLLQMLKQAYRGKAIIPSPVAIEGSARGVPQTLFQPEAVALFSEPANETWRSAWSVTEKLLTQMRDFAAQDKLAFGVTIIPDPIAVLPGSSWREAAARALGVSDLDYPTSRIAKLGKTTGIPTLSLVDALRAYADREQSFLYGFPPKLGNGHLNGTGAQVAGVSIADWICRQRDAR